MAIWRGDKTVFLPNDDDTRFEPHTFFADGNKVFALIARTYQCRRHTFAAPARRGPIRLSANAGDISKVRASMAPDIGFFIK
jgi:hypothetical protein